RTWRARRRRVCSRGWPWLREAIRQNCWRRCARLSWTAWTWRCWCRRRSRWPACCWPWPSCPAGWRWSRGTWSRLPLGAELGLRERKKVRTRGAIQHHALRLFREQGYEETTVSQIAEAAEVSESTFFRYFASKEATVLEDDF